MASLASTFHLPVPSESVQEYVTGAAFDGSFNTARRIRLTTKMLNLTVIYPDPRGASYYDSIRDKRRLPPKYNKLGLLFNLYGRTYQKEDKPVSVPESLVRTNKWQQARA